MSIVFVYFLALPDFVSSATSWLRFLRNQGMDPRQILWEATYPLYLQTVFFFFKISLFKFLRYFTSAWLCQQSYGLGAGVRRPSVNCMMTGFSKPLQGFRPNFMGSYLSAISPEHFLALLDYVSRAHEIAIYPSSVVRPSVRPSVSQLSLNLMHGFLSNFGCWFPWAIRSDVFLI